MHLCNKKINKFSHAQERRYWFNYNTGIDELGEVKAGGVLFNNVIFSFFFFLAITRMQINLKQANK